MRRSVRVGLAVLGAATAVYGFASLTGRWLGTPPWWERAAPRGEDAWNRRCDAEAFDRSTEGRPGLPSRGDPELDGVAYPSQGGASSPDQPSHPWNLTAAGAARPIEPRPSRELITTGGIAAGLALAALGSWPRRRAVAPS